MLERCYRPNNKNFPHYGGRGIYVCLRWQLDFWAFVEDMGERPEGTSIDRIDNDDIYSPLNCRWATPQQQVDNRRPRKPVSWWRENFGLYENPYVYGPMPYKQTSLAARTKEAVERGWHIPRKK